LNFWTPITLDEEGYLLDGQHRLEAAKRMGLKYIDVVIQNTTLLSS
jgi:ParB-like chromosome segregation protein Spo0J